MKSNSQLTQILNDENEKNSIKKEQKKTWANLANPQNLWLESWDHNNP
jgi:hypothetical protein